MRKLFCLFILVSTAAVAQVPPPYFTPQTMPATTNQIQQNNQHEAIATMERQTQQNQALANQEALTSPYPIVGLQQGVQSTQQALSVASQQQMKGQTLPPSELNSLQTATQMEQSEASLPLPPVLK